MTYSFLADLILAVHFLFILFVLFGGLLLLHWRWRWRWLIIPHLVAVLWGLWIEWGAGLCPLTPLEKQLRQLAGEGGYHGGFIEHYLGGLIYPAGLSHEIQLILGVIVVGINLLIYGVILLRHRKPGGGNG